MLLTHPRSSRIELLKSVQVLVVDNDQDSRVLYHALLKGCGANVVSCDSIKEALTVFDWLSPQILLCEMRFLGESIETLVTKLHDMERKGGQYIPAIAITTLITDGLAQILNTGFEGFLLKPIDLDELVCMMRHLVRTRKTKLFAYSPIETKLRAKRATKTHVPGALTSSTHPVENYND
ncbi:response regulator [Leptolyngbya sp. FACHB-321]|uniref:response regulator n=1 Tax=Leptolyngbya sp. FACHB-321 TaxID=2692807 RepID=UPI00168397E3|nr:response regulator [Leptolyngbya sp. FACHB-321]MBD2037918.1 response regulator [Leptolyngbya sp. FACHB-321]